MNDFDFGGFIQSDDEALDTSTGRGCEDERVMGFIRMEKPGRGYVPMPGSIEEMEMAEKAARKARKARRLRNAA